MHGRFTAHPDSDAATSEWLQSRPVAHRGLHDVTRPENSLGAFEAAATRGYAIELDVQLTADDRVVVFHDANTLRMTGRDLAIASTTFADVAAAGLAGSDYVAPELAEVLQIINGRVPILVELKVGPKRALLCREVAAMLARYAGDSAVQSFDPRIVGWFRKRAPDIPRGQLCTRAWGGDVPFLVGVLLAVMLSNFWTRPDFLGYDVRALPSRPLRFWQVVLHAPVLLWTVRSTQDYAVASSIGANVIFEGVLPP